MESLLKSDIFFFITSIAVVLFTIVFLVVGYYAIKTMKNISDVSESLKETVENTKSQLAKMSEQVRESTIFSSLFGKRKKREKKETK